MIIMVRSRNGGNRDGLGLYEMMKLALTHPFSFSLVLFMLKFHMTSLTKKFLGIH